MTMLVNTFMSNAVAEGSGTTEVEVEVEIGSMMVTFVASAAVAFTNMPSAVTELFSLTGRRVPASLVNRTRARIACVSGSVNGAAGSVLAAQYSTDGGSVWNYLDHSAGPTVAITAITGDSVVSGAWVNLNVLAKADVLLRMVGSGGNGAADPTIAHLLLEIE